MKALLFLVPLALLGGVLLFAGSTTQEPSPLVEKGGAEPGRIERAQAPSLPFVDVAEEAGVDWTHVSGASAGKYLPETMGGGLALFDYDDDGDADLLLVQSAGLESSALYRNESTPGAIHFVDVTAEAGLARALAGSEGRESYGMGVAVGDYDGDGDRDLFFTAVGEDRLLRNDDGVFVDQTTAAGVGGGEREDSWSTGAGFFDADLDGDLDLFVLRYVRWSETIDDALDFRLDGVGRAYGPPQEYGGTFPVFYRNRGDGTYEDLSERAGVRVAGARGEPLAKALGLLFVDLENDGFLDVYVANDTTRNFLFQNRFSKDRENGAFEGGFFEETGEFLGLAYDRDGAATGAMGVDAGHYRDDANLGILVGNFAAESSSVFRAQDDPEFFVDETLAEGLGPTTRSMLTFGVLLFDVDLDGRLDYLQTNGHVEPEIAAVDAAESYRQPGQLFWNTGRRQSGRGAAGEATFESMDPSKLGALAEPIAGRGAARADLDGDGDLDVVVTRIDGRPRILRNDQSTGHHWLRVRVAGGPGDPDAIGARVELRAPGRAVQRGLVSPTRSYLAQVEPTLTFGLGRSDRVDAVVVTWPDGKTRTVETPPIDRVLVVERPAG